MFSNQNTLIRILDLSINLDITLIQHNTTLRKVLVKICIFSDKTNCMFFILWKELKTLLKIARFGSVLSCFHNKTYHATVMII